MKLRPSPKARSFFNRGIIFFITPAALVIAFCVVASVALLHSSGPKTGTLRASLNEQLASEFPVLKGSIGARATRFEQTTRLVNGREVAGLTARVEEAKGANDPGDAAVMPAGLKPVEQEALRLMAKRNGGGAGELRAFYPEQYTDSFVVEGGGVSAVVRPLGAQASAATVENGHVVYRGAYAETDSLHALEAGRSEEFLYLRSRQAPRRFEYELSEVKGAGEVVVENGGVRFAGEAGPGLRIEAPWAVDSRGEKREDVVRWELGEAGANGKRLLSLVVAKEAELSYPLVIDPSWSNAGSLSTARTLHTATLLPNGKILVAGGFNISEILADGTVKSGFPNSAELYDPATGAWTPTGSLTTGRAEHTATLLPNGKVLVAGGNNGNALNSAELYDPATGTWTQTGSMTTARRRHTATLLPNGKVLVAGGLNSDYVNSAELYDPATGTWTQTGSLNQGRQTHTATLLPNGKVLVAGGFNSDYIKSAELYDPATGMWTQTGSLITGRYGHTATLLPDGKVLVAGGFYQLSSLRNAELYDPATGMWTQTGSLNQGRYYHTATLLPNGKVLVAGGDSGGALDGTTIINSAELYDPATGTWTQTGFMRNARRQHTATLLPNGKVFIIGGQTIPGDALSTTYYVLTSTELYEPADGLWTPTGSLKTARTQHTATLLQNGKVLVAGGNNGNAINSAELYDPATGAWTPTGSLTTGRAEHTATLLPNGKVLVAGGAGSGGGFLNSAELYDPATGAWTQTGSLIVARFSHTTTLLPNGKVLVAGGFNSDYVKSAELYDPATGAWTQTGSLITGRYGHTATLLPNGKVLVAGGLNGGNALNSAELYDPATGTWTQISSMTTARTQHTATLLQNGKVLVAGGAGSGGGAINSAELYDPSTGAWTPTGSMTTGRAEHTATLLPNGKVLVAGGHNGNALNSAELYDPATGAWTGAAALYTGRYNHTATLLPNGDVFIAGGAGSGGNALDSAELHDLITGAWTATTSLSTNRYNHTATLLPNGKVLVAGGFNPSGGGFLDSAELYDPATGTWTPTGSLNTGRTLHTATLLPNGKVLVAGGQVDGGNALNSAELYDPATGMWTQTGSLNQGRYYHTTTLLPDGKALVVGGFNGNYLAEAELYDPATGAWTQTGSLNTGRYNHTTTLLASGKVLVAGGVNPDVKFDASGLYIGGYLMSAELYDPATGMWTQTGSLNMRRSQHTATLLPDGKVLVAGGYIIKLKDTGDPVFGNLYLDSAELYDPATGTWTQTGSLITGRTEHTATLLPNGKVLVAGGQVQGFGGPAGVTNVAELYDPATGAWTQTGSMTTARRAHTATLLANGKVLAAAGLTKNAELYDTELGFASSSQPVITSAPSHLQLGSKLSLTGTRFQGVSGSSSDNTQSSSTNYPVVRLFSLVDGQTRFLSPDPATNWSSTSFISQAVTDFPKGYALLTVTANGIPSDGRLIRVSGQSQATFSNLSAPTITYGDTPTTLSGKISAASGFPTGSVGITLNGVTQQAAIQPDGTFSSNFNTSTLSTPGSPFTIIYSYGGDATYDGDLDSSKTLRVNKATAAVALSNLSHDFDGAAKFATATTTPSGLTVNISYSQGGSPVSSPTKAGSYDVSAVINDPNYQGSATGTLVINPDTVAPTVTINQAAGQADPTSNSTINFTVIFSEPVSNFSTGDVTFVTNTAGATSAEVTGSDTTYNVAVTGMTADGVIKVSIPAGAATDVADNPNQASTSTDNEVTWKLPAITSSYVVTKTADTNDGACDADCSLREAITQANIIPGKGDITFDLPGAGPHQIQLLTALPALSESVDILNTSGELISVVGRNPVGLFSVFTVNAGQTVNMSRLTIRGGFNGSGGGIIVFGTLNLTDSTVTENIVTNNGGGIYVGPGGTLNLTNSTVSKNIAENNNGTGEGGGIYNGGTLNVTNSTINGNSSHRGAGISNRGTLNLTNSTISGNYANGFLTGNSAPCQFDTQACPGGGIYNSGTLNVTNSTLFQNTAKVSGGIHNAGAATLRGSIVANNRVTDQQDEECCRTFTIGPDLQGSFNSEGFNLIRSTKDATITQTANAGTDLLNVDPNMDGTLADNGGPTLTHRLNPGSPAIDKGKNFSTAATDQRGFLRTADDPSIPNAAGGDGTDIGAFEYGSFEYQPIVVTTAVDELDADSEPGSGTGTSLREAIRYANSLGAGSHLITFAPNLAGQTLMLGSAWSNASDDESTSALVVNGADISIQGPATAPGITLSVAPGENLRHFFVPGTPNTGLTLSNLTLSGGNPQLSGHNFGGAVSAQGPLTVRNCTFTGNSSGAGGAIQSDGGAPSLLVENSTFSGNMSGGHGAAVSSAANQTTFRHLTVTNNTGGSAIALGGAATMVNTIVAGNGDDSFEMGAGGALSAQTTNNICGAATVPGLTNGSNNNLLGVPASPLYLGPLASNGGPTQTHAIGAGSIAINAGVAISGLTTDQRGSERSVGGLPDIGAYEEPTGNGDPDGDSLTNFQEWLIGSDPNSIDSDGDGYNDATEMLAGTNPASASSVPPGTHVERVLGYGPARGLDLTGNFVYAFNVGTNGAVGQAGDANFTDDNAPGITMSAPNQVNPWGAPSFGSTAADDVLENVYKSIRWANSADANPALRKITVDLSGLTVGRRYKLQLLFGEACCNRNFDISVEGSLVADDFKPALAQGSLSLTKTGSAFVHEFVANDTTLNIVLDATNVADPSLDRNPILNGVTLELLAASSAAAAPPSITPAGGSYANSVQVSLVNNSPGTTLRYTTDGSTPTETHGTIYSGPFTLTSSATVKAIAYGGGLQPSAVTSATYTVAANAAPTVSASPNPATTGEGIPVQIALSGTDSDDNNLTFTVTQQPTHGTLSVISTPDCTAVNTCTASVTYTPAAGYSGPDSFKFKANDGAADSNEATVSITVNAVAHLSISDVAKAEGNTGQTAFTFTVSLDSPAPAGGVSFNWSTADGTAAAPGDYTAVTNASGSIAQGNTSTTITVQVKGDAAQEPNETFFVNVSGVTGATVSDAQGQGTILNDDGAPSAGQILISEFRLRGPDPDGAGPLTGSDDEFIELYNNTGSDFVVADSSPLSVAQAGWAIVSSDAPTTAKVVVAAGTTIPARGHFLVANGVGYSLSAYAAADAPGGVPATYNVDIPEGSGLALFRTGNPALFAQPAERLDSVGFASAPPPFFEGTPLQPAGGITAPAEHSFVRKLTSGLPQDTDDNASDFLLVSTTGAKLDGVQSLLGAPGPENLSSLVNRGSKIKAALFDSAKTTADAPNRERTSTPVTNGDAGTLLLRRTFTNNTGATVTALRFRVVKMTAGPGGGAGIADLRLLNTASSTVSITGGGSKTTTNMTLDVSPAQAMGGGMNSTVTASIPDGIAPGSTADIQFTLGVVTPGSFNFFVIVEALPGINGPAGELGGSPGPADLDGSKRGGTTKGSPGKGAPAKSRQ